MKIADCLYHPTAEFESDRVTLQGAKIGSWEILEEPDGTLRIRNSSSERYLIQVEPDCTNVIRVRGVKP